MQSEIRMRRLFILALFAAMAGLTGCSYFSSSNAPPKPPKTEPVVVQGSRIPKGTQIQVQLDQSLTKDSKAGEEYTAKVVQQVRDEKGRELIPIGAQVIGQVQEVRPGSKSEPVSIVLTADKLRVQGQDVRIDGRYVATTIEPAKKSAKSSATSGAAKGAVGGLIFGGPVGAIVGGATGAATNTVFSLGTAGHEAALPVGTVLTLQIERSVSVAARQPTKKG
jgi:hypothetical protein